MSKREEEEGGELNMSSAAAPTAYPKVGGRGDGAGVIRYDRCHAKCMTAEGSYAGLSISVRARPDGNPVQNGSRNTAP